MTLLKFRSSAKKEPMILAVDQKFKITQNDIIKI